jgi:hypothetical protein
MIENFHIKTPRQKRAILALLEKDSIEVKDLGYVVGALNPRQIISELRRQGFEEIIQTKFFEIIDRDGNRCRPGKYFIPPEQKPRIQEFLKRDGLPAVPKVKQPKHSNKGYKKHVREFV